MDFLRESEYEIQVEHLVEALILDHAKNDLTPDSLMDFVNL
jgi:hypothetical protein